MAAPITTFVDVTVSLTGAIAAAFSFGVPIGVFTHNITNNRIDGPFFSITEVNDAGFTAAATPAINKWATTVFAQTNTVDSLLIGRRIPPAGGNAAAVAQVDAVAGTAVDMTTEFNDSTVANWIVFPATEATGDFAAFGMTEQFGQLIVDNTGGTAGIGGVVAWEYWNGTAWTVLAGIVDGTTGFTAAVSAGQTVTWTVPGDWAKLDLSTQATGASSTSLFYVRAAISTVYATNPIYDVGTAAGDTNWTATMDNIELWQQLNGASDWYITNIETRIDVDILEVAAWTEARAKIFMAQSSDADVLTNGAGNIAADLKGFSYVRTALWWDADDTEYLDGAMTGRGGGFNLDVPGGVGIWGMKQLSSVTASLITGSEATNIFLNAANFLGRNLSLSFSQEGTMAIGKPRFIDVTTSIDWLIKRNEEALLSLMVGAPTKIPFTNAGINQFVGAVQGVLDSGVSFGHLSEDVPPTVTAPDVSTVSDADKANRVLTLEATATLAGAIQKVILVINLSF